MATETSTFALKIDADAEPAAEAAAELEKFRAAIVKSQDAITSYRKAQGQLRGSTDEVKDAKAKLAAAIKLEQANVSKSGLEILKLGGSYDKLAKSHAAQAREQKKASTEQKTMRDVIAAIGGPVDGLTGKLEAMKGLMPVLATGWGAVAAAIVVGVAAFAIAAAAVADLTVKFTEWLLTTADAQRNLRLTREAFSGSAKNAEAWGHVIDWAAENTALTTAQMNELVVATEKAGRGARISGQGLVDLFHATATAAGAGRKDVGDFFSELVMRGKTTGRVGLDLSPLSADMMRFRNAGIDTKRLFADLGIKEGMRGAVVSTDKLAAALADVSKNRFADLNKEKMLSLGAQWDRIKDNFARFTEDLTKKGGALEPLLQAIQSVANAFDLSTDSGQEFKKAVTKYGTELANVIVTHLPEIKAFVLEVMHLAGVFLNAASAVIEWANSAKGSEILKFALIGIGAALGIILAIGAVVVGTLVTGFIAIGFVVSKTYSVIKALFTADWSGIGKSIVDGITTGLQSAWTYLKSATSKLVEDLKAMFKVKLQIGSPSRITTKYGLQTGEGQAVGMLAMRPAVRAAAASLAEASTAPFSASPVASSPAPAARASGAGANNSRTVTVGTVEFHAHVSGGANAREIAETLSSSSFLEGFQSSFKLLLQGAAIPTDVAPQAGG